MECSDFAAYVETVIMYAMAWTHPAEIRLILSNFAIRPGHMFLTIEARRCKEYGMKPKWVLIGRILLNKFVYLDPCP